MVEVWKVHGSLDWFVDEKGVPLSLPCVCHKPKEYSPAIVTPGAEKYKLTHLEPFRSIIAHADDAIVSAKAVLAIGYGFNDSHIEPKLVERCQRDGALIVILTKALTPASRAFLAGCVDYMAFEECEEGTRIISPDNPAGTELGGVSIWKLSEFVAQLI